MSSSALIVLVGFASYALISVTLTAVAWTLWRLAARRQSLAAAELIALRLLPPIGGAFLTAAVVVPAFLRFEPTVRWEEPGPVLIALSLVTTMLFLHGAVRVWRATSTTRALTRQWPTLADRSVGGVSLHIIDSHAPIVAVIGLWRPRVVVAARVVSACTPEELACVAAHEQAHVAAKDNVKRILMAAIPDPLSWFPATRGLDEHWQLAAEHAADERAAAGDPKARLILASALIKVARLAVNHAPVPRLAATFIGVEGVESRVQRLLDEAPSVRPTTSGWMLLPLLAALAVVAVPAHENIHTITEALVALGR